MPKIELSEIVPFSADQMYDLVVDVDKYGEFLPWCVGARRFREEENQFVAELTVAFKGLREKFQTLDTFSEGEWVEVKLLSGPFRRLENRWSFTQVDGGCKVDFYIDFKFKSGLLNMTMGPLFTQASKRMISAFRERAEELYG